MIGARGRRLKPERKRQLCNALHSSSAPRDPYCCSALDFDQLAACGKRGLIAPADLQAWFDGLADA